MKYTYLLILLALFACKKDESDRIMEITAISYNCDINAEQHGARSYENNQTLRSNFSILKDHTEHFHIRHGYHGTLNVSSQTLVSGDYVDNNDFSIQIRENGKLIYDHIGAHQEIKF